MSARGICGGSLIFSAEGAWIGWPTLCLEIFWRQSCTEHDHGPPGGSGAARAKVSTGFAAAM